MQKGNSVASQKNGGDSKTQCEQTTIVDDVFNEGLQNSDCLAILLMRLHNLENQVNSIKYF